MPMLTSGADSRDALIAELQNKLQAAQMEVRGLRQQVALVESINARAIAGIKRVLDPLYGALCVLYNEMEPIGGVTVADAPDAKRAKWEAVKQNLAPRLREAIDLLLLQGTMKRTQMAAALKMDYSNCTKNVIGMLIRQGWVVDNGGTLSLKEL